MKFKILVESEMINELSNDGKWVTFKNGQHTYIGKGGEIETGTLKGYNVNNTKAIKGKYKQLQDQTKKKKKQEQKAKSREVDNTIKKGAKEVLKDIAGQSRSKEQFDSYRKELSRSIKDDANGDKNAEKMANAIANYGTDTKNAKKAKRKELGKTGKAQTNATKEFSRALQGDIKNMRDTLKKGGKEADEIRDFLKQSKQQGYDFRKDAWKTFKDANK